MVKKKGKARRKVAQPPFCLTIAGLDPTGGAGATADLRVFKRLGAYGLSAFTAITPQNTHGVKGIHPVSINALKQELASVFEDFSVAVAKTGQIPNRELAKVIVASLRANPVPLVIDPVMVPTRGMWLVEKDAVAYMKRYLLPLATIITPNLEEAAWLSGVAINSKEDMMRAAEVLVPKQTNAVVITAGDGITDGAHDLFYDGDQFIWMRSKRRKVGDVHGSGCHFSSALAGYISQGHPLDKAAKKAKHFISDMIDKHLIDPSNEMKLINS